MKLDPRSLRVLGALMEKEMTTPETYPLSLNSLVAASNQKTSRDPVMSLSEEVVRQALDVLHTEELITSSRDARVPKYEHRIRTVLNLRRDETAVICLLLLRGPQTPGELRGRADRMFAFDDIAAVQATLDRLAGRDAALVRVLPRMAGSREARWVHRLGDEDHEKRFPSMEASGSEPEWNGKVESSGHEIDELRLAVASLEARIRSLEEKWPEQSIDKPPFNVRLR